MTKQVYVSGALTGVSNVDALKLFYEEIGGVCRQFGLDPYIPHLVSDPVANPDLTPREVYELDRSWVSQSTLVIAYAGVASLGVGGEIEIARQCGVPVVLVMEQEAIVSRMARGNPAVVKEIRFSNNRDALSQLASWLTTNGYDLAAS